MLPYLAPLEHLNNTRTRVSFNLFQNQKVEFYFVA